MRGHGAIPGLGLGGGIPEVGAPLEQGAAATMAAALMEAGGASGVGSGSVRVKELLEV